MSVHNTLVQVLSDKKYENTYDSKQKSVLCGFWNRFYPSPIPYDVVQVG